MDYKKQLEAGIVRLRQFAYSRMNTALFVQRDNGGGDHDLETGKRTPVLEPVYGSAETPVFGWVEEMEMLGGALLARSANHTEVFSTATLRLPMDAPWLLPGDIVTIVADPWNPILDGQRLIVASHSVNSQSITQDFQVRAPQKGELPDA